MAPRRKPKPTRSSSFLLPGTATPTSRRHEDAWPTTDITNGKHPQIRRAVRSDMHEISAIIQKLADFEKASDSNKATPEKLLETANFADNALPEHTPGFPLNGVTSRKGGLFRAGDWGSSCWHGAFQLQLVLASPGVHLENLYVRPTFRRRSLAKLLFSALTEEAHRLSHGEGRLEWLCLRGNEGALTFCERIGGSCMEEWVSIRVASGNKLEHLKHLADEAGATNSK